VIMCYYLNTVPKMNNSLIISRKEENSYFDEKAIALSPALAMSIIEEKAKNGDTDAQEWIYKNLYEAKIGQKLPPSERFAILLEKANSGEIGAVKWIVKAIISGELNQLNVSAKERFEHLKAWALKGDRFAQQLLVEIIKKGEFIPDINNLDKRYILLESLMMQKIQPAGHEVCEILICGGIGLQFSKLERMNKLVRLSEEGYDEAQKAYAALLLPVFMFSIGLMDPYREELHSEDFGSLETRIFMLIRYGNEGNSHARYRIVQYISEYFRSTSCVKLKENIFHECISSIFRWTAQGSLSCQIFCREGNDHIPKTVLALQPYYTIFDLVLDPSPSRLKEQFHRITYDAQVNNHYLNI